ncbi:MAG TPA: PIN domain-containing protein [Acidimicrobiales bacterium]|nr:PIN domain-containing protein [Acidimicrobiales bacterium]
MLLVDTGPLVAAADRDDPDHLACRDLLEGDEGPLVTSALVIAEAAYLVDRQLGPVAEAALFASVASGDLRVEDLGRSDWERIAELVGDYADMRLGGADASLVALAERLGATRLATLDHRHFRVVRPRHAQAFELLP